MLNCVVSFAKMFNMWHLLWHMIHKNYNLTLGKGKILHNIIYMQLSIVKLQFCVLYDIINVIYCTL
jgi:hypothetical protein